MSTSAQVMELFNIFSETWGKEKAQVVVQDIEQIVDSRKKDLATKGDLKETELKLTKEIELIRREIKEVELRLTKEIELKIEQAKTSTIKWVIGWMAGFIMAQTAAIIAILKFLK